jgi:hypothetical protein
VNFEKKPQIHNKICTIWKYNSMKPIKNILLVSMFAAAFNAQAAPINLGTGIAGLTVFSNTYTSTGANSIVYGSMLGGDVTSTGANAAVHGDVTSVNATNIGGGTSLVDQNIDYNGAINPAVFGPIVQVTGLNTGGVGVGGNVVSGGVLTVGGATGGVSPGPTITGSITSTGASTIGDSATIGGDMLSGGVATTGANSLVKGSIRATGPVTTGNDGDVTGDVWSGTVSTIGANSDIGGNVDGGTTANSISASATVGSQNNVTDAPDLSAVRTDVLAEAAEVTTAQTALLGLGFGTPLSLTPGAPVMVGNHSLTAGVYSAASFSTTASTTLTLQGDGTDGQSWVFNIADILAFGASSNIVMNNVGSNASVYWNSYAGYITSGGHSNIIGTLLAHTYIAIGAHSKVLNIGTTCGAVYSATSYVSAGDSAEIGGRGCSAVSVVSEPTSVLLFGLGLFGLAGLARRKKV